MGRYDRNGRGSNCDQIGAQGQATSVSIIALHIHPPINTIFEIFRLLERPAQYGICQVTLPKPKKNRNLMTSAEKKRRRPTYFPLFE